MVVLNSCNSAAQPDLLVAGPVVFAVGMGDEVLDGDAIHFAAQFYAAIANGQSVGSSRAAANAFPERSGLRGADVPVLVSADGLDPFAAFLVMPPEAES